MKTCLCGCGAEIPSQNRYVHGHSNKGKAHSPEWIEKMRAGMRKAWEKDKTRFVRAPESYIEAGKKQRGRIVPTHVREKISAALTGRKLCSSHKEKSSKGWLHLRGPLNKESELKRRNAISEQRMGCHGYGRAARDKPDHCKAKHWVIRAPNGIVFEFDNLQSWCRSNEWRFLPDYLPGSKLDLWRRAVSGFNGMRRTDKKGQHHWRGWTLVSQIERQELGALDLLGREPRN